MKAGRAAILLATYLAATVAPAVLASLSGGIRPMLILVAHVSALAVLVFLLRGADGDPSPARRWAIAVAPLVAIPFLYAELPTLMAGLGQGYRDAFVQPMEYALFGGGTPARALAPALHGALGQGAGTVVSELLFASYLSYYFIIYVPPILLLARREHALYQRTLTGMMIAFLSCFFVFVLFPVEGPRYIWPAPDGAMHGPIRAFTLRVVAAGSSRGAEFPSSHVAVSVVQSLLALRWSRPLGVAMSIATVLLSVAVVFAGFHYAVDVMAGAVVGMAAFVAVNRPVKG